MKKIVYLAVLLFNMLVVGCKKDSDNTLSPTDPIPVSFQPDQLVGKWNLVNQTAVDKDGNSTSKDFTNSYQEFKLNADKLGGQLLNTLYNEATQTSSTNTLNFTIKNETTFTMGGYDDIVIKIDANNLVYYNSGADGKLTTTLSK